MIVRLQKPQDKILFEASWTLMPTGAMPTQKNNNPDKKSENNVDDNNPDINTDSNNPKKCVNCGYFVGNYFLRPKKGALDFKNQKLKKYCYNLYKLN